MSGFLLLFLITVGFSFLLSYMTSLPSHNDFNLSSNLVLIPTNLENQTPAYKSATVNVKVERDGGAQIIFHATKGPCLPWKYGADHPQGLVLWVSAGSDYTPRKKQSRRNNERWLFTGQDGLHSKDYWRVLVDVRCRQSYQFGHSCIHERSDQVSPLQELRRMHNSTV